MVQFQQSSYSPRQRRIAKAQRVTVRPIVTLCLFVAIAMSFDFFRSKSYRNDGLFGAIMDSQMISTAAASTDEEESSESSSEHTTTSQSIRRQSLAIDSSNFENFDITNGEEEDVPESQLIQIQEDTELVLVEDNEDSNPPSDDNRETVLAGESAATSSNSNSDNSPDQDRLLEEWYTFNKETKNNLAEFMKSKQAQIKLPHLNLPDYIKGTYTSPQQDVILATHMSVDDDKITRLDILRRFWQGPISLALRIRSVDEINSFFSYYNQLPTNISSTWTVHFLLEYAQEPLDIKSTSFPAQYCHNRLRNLALHSTATPDYVLTVDLDFVPTFGGYPKLMKIVAEYPDILDKMKTNHKLLVVPVTEIIHIPDSWGTNSSSILTILRNITNPHNTTPSMNELVGNQHLAQTWSQNTNQLVKDLRGLQIFESGVESDLPKSREELHLLYKFGIAREWHAWKVQAPTNIKTYWKYNRNAPSRSMTYPIKKPTLKYEPYFIGYKPQLPKFWEAFRGFGLNKQSFVRECLLAGFQMEGLYELYLTHLGHQSNSKKEILKHNSKEWDNNFMPYLECKYPQQPTWLQGDEWYCDPTYRPRKPKSYAHPKNCTARLLGVS